MFPKNFGRTNQDEKILLEILKRNKTENNLNPRLSDKLLPLIITRLEGRSCFEDTNPGSHHILADLLTLLI